MVTDTRLMVRTPHEVLPPRCKFQIRYQDQTIGGMCTSYRFDPVEEAIDLFNDFGRVYNSIDLKDPEFMSAKMFVPSRNNPNNYKIHVYLKKPSWIS